jgi:serine beta-lactamase-like protein LACTB
VAKKRMETWLGLFVAGVGLVLAAVVGLFVYMSVTATPIHPDAKKVPSAEQADPAATWAAAADQARQLVRTNVAEQNLPGLSVAVGRGGDIVWAEGFGWADLEKHTPVLPDTRFLIGSASTALTSAAVGLLLEKNRLKLDDPIQTTVPAFPKKRWPVTLRQVMAHVGGIRSDGGDEENLREHCEQPVDGLKRFAATELMFEPGTRYRYSNYGWILVSAAVDAAAEEPFFAFMRRQVFEPLGMKHTGEDAAGPIPDRATFYFPKFGADPRYGPQPPSPIDMSCLTGAAGFLSTPSDLVRFVMALNGGTFLQPDTVHLLQAAQRLPSGQDTGYGLGWDLETVAFAGTQTATIGHDGEIMGGPVASFMTFPEHGIVVAVTSNTAYADTAGIAVKVAEAFAAQKRPSPGR